MTDDRRRPPVEPGVVDGKVIVITGASRGLGLGMARRWRDLGARLGLCARSPVPLEGPGVVRDTVDVTDRPAVERFARRVADELGPIDLWVSNAGVLDPVGPLVAVDPDAVDRHVHVNLLGAVWSARAYLGHLRGAGHRGVLVTISSGAAHTPYAGWSVYCATKAAVDQLSRVLALEEADRCRVLAVAPGVVDTDMQELIRSTSPDRFPAVERFRQLKEAGRFNSPAHVADWIAAWAFGPDDGDVVRRVPDEWS